MTFNDRFYCNDGYRHANRLISQFSAIQTTYFTLIVPVDQLMIVLNTTDARYEAPPMIWRITVEQCQNRRNNNHEIAWIENSGLENERIIDIFILQSKFYFNCNTCFCYFISSRLLNFVIQTPYLRNSYTWSEVIGMNKVPSLLKLGVYLARHFAPRKLKTHRLHQLTFWWS